MFGDYKKVAIVLLTYLALTMWISHPTFHVRKPFHFLAGHESQIKVVQPSFNIGSQEMLLEYVERVNKFFGKLLDNGQNQIFSPSSFLSSMNLFIQASKMHTRKELMSALSLSDENLSHVFLLLYTPFFFFEVTSFPHFLMLEILV